jgi:hypothetical protein
MATTEESLWSLRNEAIRITALARGTVLRASESFHRAERQVEDLRRVVQRAREAIAQSEGFITPVQRL